MVRAHTHTHTHTYTHTHMSLYSTIARNRSERLLMKVGVIAFVLLQAKGKRQKPKSRWTHTITDQNWL